MSNDKDRPIRVSGEERAHPAIRLLARACIALAQQQIAREKEAQEADTAPESPAADAGQAEDTHHE